MSASITAGAGPFAFGESVPTEALVAAWTPGGGKPATYWAKAECFQGGSLVYAQYAELTAGATQSGFTFGPTPLWSGGAATGTLSLIAMRPRSNDRVVATDDFTVGP
jgi:hypothetical protein